VRQRADVMMILLRDDSNTFPFLYLTAPHSMLRAFAHHSPTSLRNVAEWLIKQTRYQIT
jgi:hypothetical protein